jgi:hypothetical protein
MVARIRTARSVYGDPGYVLPSVVSRMRRWGAVRYVSTMSARPRQRPRGTGPGLPATAAGRALDDARGIVARAEADDASAREARIRYREHGMPSLEPDERIAPLLRPSERVVAHREATLLELLLRPGPDTTGHNGVISGGDLYVTTSRLLHLGRSLLAIELEGIEEMALAAERLLLTIRDRGGIGLEAGEPRLLRVQIAAAIAAGRG